jgi:hypothetical protein
MEPYIFFKKNQHENSVHSNFILMAALAINKPTFTRSSSVGEHYFSQGGRALTEIEERLRVGWTDRCGGAKDHSGTVTGESMFQVSTILLPPPLYIDDNYFSSSLSSSSSLTGCASM